MTLTSTICDNSVSRWRYSAPALCLASAQRVMNETSFCIWCIFPFSRRNNTDVRNECVWAKEHKHRRPGGNGQQGAAVPSPSQSDCRRGSAEFVDINKIQWVQVDAFNIMLLKKYIYSNSFVVALWTPVISLQLCGANTNLINTQSHKMQPS